VIIALKRCVPSVFEKGFFNMYRKLMIALFTLMPLAGVHAAEQMTLHGSIINRLDHDIVLEDSSWDEMYDDGEKFVVEAGDEVNFAVTVPAEKGKFELRLGDGIAAGTDRVACLFEVEYGTETYVNGPMRLTGPQASAEATSLGDIPATCLVDVETWNYMESMHLSVVIE
jgi:hypothetical protein